MNRELRQIYADLSAGKLTQQQALEKIRTAKQRRHETATLLAAPVWEAAPLQAAAVHYDERHVIDVRSLAVSAQKNVAERYGEIALACFERLQSIVRTHGKVLVQIVVPNDQKNALLVGLSGLLKTAALENPQCVGQLVLGDTAAVEAENGLDAIVRYENGERQVLRFTEVAAEQEKAPLSFKDDGIYLITGGTGAIGLLFAKEILARTSHSRVILTGRTELSAEKQAAVNALSAQPGRVSYRRVDLTDAEQVSGLIAGIEDRHGQLNGVLHCAGMIADNFIIKKGADEFTRVLAPKVVGTWNLDRATQDLELDWFVLFSSFAGAMGNVGQADYASANAFMDQFAAYRNRLVSANQRYGRTRSINWPLWRDGGMTLDLASEEALQRISGMQPMQTATGIEAFHRAIALEHSQLFVGEGDPAHMRRALLATPVVSAEPEMTPVTVHVENLEEKTQEYLRRQLSSLLKVPAHLIDPQAALEQYGIDSILAMKLTSRLEQTFGPLSKTLFFEYQTIGALSEYFVQSHAAKLATLFGQEKKTAEPVQEPRIETKRAPRRVSRRRAEDAKPTIASEAIAIVGLSGRYPEAVDVEAYWNNLRDGKDCITEVPKERWDWREYFSDDRTKAGHHYSKWGGFISGVDEFDPLFFNISPKEAKFIDPQERLFLQHAWMAIEDAGYTRASLQIAHDSDLAGQVGVYVGVMYSEYQLFGAEASARGNRLGIAGSAASIANRVSYVLNLHGPSITLDTMCSSSLTAIHFACQDLKLGRTSLAIAGGVNVTIHPNKYLVLSGGQFISSDGACQSFGEGGDGYIPGEGVGAVVLKRLSDAQRDGDHIYGVIRGSALNHGGKTNGYTVPNPQAQASAIARALAESNTDARHVSYIEAHGTGTKLGDPIEIAALNKAFAQYTNETGYCLIGSAKSNIGHCESAAGVAGLTKVLLQMQHQQIVPSLHSAQLNPHIDFASTPFTVNQTLRPWEQPVVDGRTLPRIAGISSFGAGGSNAHLIIEEYPAAVQQPAASGDVAIVLSARTPEQLQDKVRTLLEFVRPRVSELDLAAVAYTLQTGREAMDERAAFVVSSAAQLVEQLQAYGSGEPSYFGSVKRNREALSLFGTDGDLQQTVEKWIAGGKLAKLVDLWVKGLDLDWNKLYDEPKPRRVSLPAYPFARERYWVDVTPIEPVASKAATTAVLHPLVHTNTSDLTQQSYSSTFDYALSSAELLEMARAAVANATRSSSDTAIALRDVAFGEPAQPGTIHIALSVINAGQLEFEIYSNDEVVHCQGRAVLGASGDSVLEPEVATIEPVVATAPAVRAALVRKEIVFATATQPVERKKRATIALSTPGAANATPAASRARVTLSNTTGNTTATTSSSAVRLYDCENGIYAIDIVASRSNEILAHTLQALDRVQHEPSLKVLLLSGIEHCDAIDRKLFQRLLSFPYPIIAVQSGDVIGAGLFAAALCDFVILNEDAEYGYGADELLLIERFGSAPGAASTGKQLRAKGWTCPIVPFGDVESRAEQLASEFVTKSQDALRLLKQHLTRKITAPELQSIVAVTNEVVTVESVAALYTEIEKGRNAIVFAGDPREIADIAEFQRRIAAASVPVVAALRNDASDTAWLAALACDATVHSTNGSYSAANLVPSPLAAALFTNTFGNVLGKEILLSGATYRGADLQQRFGATHVADDVVQTATEVAKSAQKQRALDTSDFEVSLEETSTVAVPTNVQLKSNVVTLTTHAEGIAVVKIEDRQARNMFSDDVVAGVSEAFAHIANTPAYKAVVLTGYDNYFAAGGTKENLLKIQEGNAKFTDVRIFQLPLECRIPVVAAIQGHALGAGWAMGMYADFVVLGEESRFISPYMNYGFTPGAGATAILAEKIGNDIARESLFTAQYYSGSELKQRGLRLPIVPRANVLAEAMNVAKQIARAPRARLIALKEQLTRKLRATMEETYRLELAMHEQTFVGHSDTLAKIRLNFSDETETRTVVEAPVQQVVQVAVADALPALTATLRTLLAGELQMRESDIDDHTQFIDLGLDSISGVSWIRKINEKYQTAIEATKVYSYPTLSQLAPHVKDEAQKLGTLPVLSVAPAPPPAKVETITAPVVVAPKPVVTNKLTRRNRNTARFATVAAAPAKRAIEPIAIIGIAGQFPQARNTDQFWQNIAQGRNCITEVSRERWDVDALYQPGDVVAGKTYSQWLGALEDYDKFDPLFFNISPTEAESMDPQQRLFLQACWHGIEDAGYDARALSGSKTGVFVGCAGGDYLQASRKHELSAQGFTGAAMSILSARIAYFLNLQGPCLSIDTACSSSLVAIANACDSLNGGSSDLALAGGVYVMSGPDMHIKTSQAAMLSPDGKCYTFDQRANGFVPGEGVGVVVLKRLSDAQRDGDVIHGVIQGWGINQDGRTNGITAPNPESQTRLEQDVYERYEINPENIQLIEAHGTGTKLGDPIEVEGLKQAFRKYTQKTDYCALGSVKSNIGHTLTAAGIAGVLKLVLALKNKQLPPTIHFERLNEHIELKDTPFFVNSQLRAWNANGAPRQAAISSFGFSGTNAHMVIGEYVPSEVVRPAVVAPVIVPLSARTADQLEQKVRDLVEYVRTNPNVVLSDLAYTLQTGRQPFDERLGFVANSTEQLVQKLEAYLGGDRSAEVVRQGQAKRGRTSLAVLGQDDDLLKTVVEKCIAENKLATLLELWVHGIELDWQRLYGEKPRRISAPLYPFAKERYWIDTTEPAATVAATAVLHPLLHCNTSDLSEHRYSSTFSGDEFFFANNKSLPGVVHLEMARAAIEHAVPARPESAVLELRDVVWGEQVVVDAKKEIRISLWAAENEQIGYEIYGGDVVHCQGRALLNRDAATTRLDLEQLESEGQALVQVRLPVADTSGGFVLHPALLDGALEATEPASLELLRIVAPCPPETVAWVRQAADGVKLDIDLCDANGNVCVQLRGFTSRAPERPASTLIATPQWRASAANGSNAEWAEHHVLSLTPQPQKSIAHSYSDYAVECFERIQTIVRSKPQGRVLVQIVVPNDPEHVLLAGLSGLLRTAAQELPQFHGQLILVPANTTEAQLSEWLEDEKRHGLDTLVRYENNERQVLRWQEVAATDNAPIAFRNDGVYLITGGTGGLGILFAREIRAQAPQATIVLTGRGSLSGEKKALVRDLNAQYRQLDLGDLAQVRRVLAEVQNEYRLTGILHCAGMNADNFIAKKSSAEFRTVLAPKVTGTYHLDEATQDVELDFFMLFSSIAGALGNLGQADYAAANGFMDQFANYRNQLVEAKQRHGRTRAINWPLWQDGGMSIDAATQELIRSTMGVQPLQTETGLEAFHRTLALSCDQTLVVEGVREIITTHLQKARIFEPQTAIVKTTARPAVSLNQLQQEIKGLVAGVLRIDASVIDADQPFAEYGLDSFLGAELIVAVNKKYGTQLSHARLFDYSTVSEFARFLATELPSQQVAETIETLPAPVAATAQLPILKKSARANRVIVEEKSTDKIAIIGMSGRYPQASDLNQYWANLTEGKNSVVEVPSSRWDVNRFYDADRTKKDKTYSKWLGAIEGIDHFDPLFFRISPQEAEFMDPQHRLFLQESYKAFEDAGYSTTTLSNKKCGVYLGISTNEYMTLLSRAGVLSAPVTSNSYAIAAARIAYHLNLKGPAMSVDTACSSSLVAIHLACQAILNGDIDMALAGGVSLWLTPDSYVAMSKAGMFSPDGQCKTFDDSANGIVNGEGVGAVVLKRLSDAERDGDVIHAVILGSGINQDGRTNGITAPSVNSQIELERAIYSKFDIDPESISYIETHGTGTKLGDPIELEALSTVFKERTSRKNFCALGSVKSNIGHTTSAAGVAGLQKVLLAMRHRSFVPTLNVTKTNARFDFDNSPFYVNRELRSWDVAPNTPRRAAVSSFGFSGTNAHLVIEEYASPVARPAAQQGQVIVPLSARTPEQLRQRSRDLLDSLVNAEQQLDLAAIAYTLQVGREPMEERVAFVVSSVAELLEKVEAYVNGERGIDGIVQGRVEPGSDGMNLIGRDEEMQEAIEKWIARRKLNTLADSWTRGLNLDWNKLYDGAKPRRVSLPTYPFAKERCWIDVTVVPDDRAETIAVNAADVESIEDLIGRIADDSLESADAVQALRLLV